MSDSTRDFIICQIRESLENNDVLCLDDLTSRILLYNSLIALIVLPVEQAKRSGTGGEKNPCSKNLFQICGKHVNSTLRFSNLSSGSIAMETFLSGKKIYTAS
mgnify:CR=1 FL=1